MKDIKVKNLLLQDKDDDLGAKDLYIFKDYVSRKEVEKVIKEHKENNEGEWNMDSIMKAIKNNFEVEQVICLGYHEMNIMGV